MLKPLGKLLQIAGLITLPAAMVMQMTAGLRSTGEGFSVSAMLLMLLFGVALFGIGRIVEGYSGS
jgi:hypothetical protein